ncbi:MAG TPA: M20/M25/M40 family metallo-hydrolase, partial [Bacteroidales bacterium]|nr:M20/M25/M40 family metallo-hydrolase [Bacteroidales bacterium]
INKVGFRLASWNGGNMRNAIPREATLSGAVLKDKYDLTREIIDDFAKTIKKEFALTEPNMEIKVEKITLPENIIAPSDTLTLVNTVFALPNGVMRMSDSMPDLVETSNNLAIVETTEKSAKIYNLMRSSVNSAKDAVGDKITAIAELAGGKIELTGGYPGWNPNMNSPILKTMKEVYLKKYGKEPKIKAIHAGLECGLFGLTYPDWDMISFGPTIRHPHSPDEKVNIESVGKFWDYLVETLKNIPIKK